MELGFQNQEIISGVAGEVLHFVVVEPVTMADVGAEFGILSCPSVDEVIEPGEPDIGVEGFVESLGEQGFRDLIFHILWQQFSRAAFWFF